MDPNVDEHSVMTYLSQFPKAKLKPGAPLRAKTLHPKRARAYGPGKPLPVIPHLSRTSLHRPEITRCFLAEADDERRRINPAFPSSNKVSRLKNEQLFLLLIRCGTSG